MTLEIGLTLGIIASALVLFATEKLRVDVVAIMVLITIGVLKLIPGDELFSGFSNHAVITVWAVYMVSGGMFQTGVADMMGNAILRVAGDSEPRLVAVIMLTVGVLSAFINNVGATAMLLPAVVGIARRTKVPVSKLLIPLAFASLLGGGMTLIGTPANILASGILTERGLVSFDFFEFTPLGLSLLAVGILYMVLLGRHLLPIRAGTGGPDEEYLLREYVSHVAIPASSQLAGSTLLEAGLGRDHDLTVLGITRQDGSQPRIDRNTRLLTGDELVVEGNAEDLMKACNELGLVLQERRDLDVDTIQPGQVKLIEATLAPQARIVDQPLKDVRFRDKYGFTALAISRHGEVITRRLRDIPLKFGDALLLQGPQHRIPQLQQSQDFLVLEPVEINTLRRRKAPLAVGALLAAIGLTLFGGFDISLAMVIAAIIMILTGALTIDEAYASVDWRTVFLVAGMLPLGLAMEATGTARFLANIMLDTFGPWGPIATLAGVYLLAALVTQPMSNAAAVVLIVPIALDTAAGVGADYKAFTVAVVVGAATSFLSPVGHKANVLVFGPGGYKFTDYTRVGFILTLLLLAVSLILIPALWPLFN
ncbi:MAG: SLC13 family permease [Anaerolineales bacterium]